MEVQLGFFDAIGDLLGLDLRFVLAGIVLIGVSFYWLYKRKMLTVKICIVLILFYYYLTILLSHIVGIPTIRELMRLSALGGSFFQPNINLIPFANGLNMEFLLNVLLFIPLGFLCPMISTTYQQIKKVLLIGFGFSLIIELSQLFTLHRATDVNDMISNTLGTLIGYLCFRFMVKLRNEKCANGDFGKSGLPVLYLVVAFIITFVQF